MAGENFDNPQNLRVVAGAHDLTADEPYWQIRAVDKIIQHEDYNSFAISNDISLLRVEAPFDFSENSKVEPIAALQDRVNTTGMPSIISGWGTTAEGGQTPDQLKAVEAPIISNERRSNVDQHDS